MRLSIAQAVELVSTTAWTHRPRPAGFVPRIDATLRASYCARLHQPPPPRWEEEADPFWGPPKGAGSPREAPADPGLVGGVKFDGLGIPPRRNGFRGLTGNGKRKLREGAAAMEERRACCGFWTITLPDANLQRLMELDTWPVFQSSIRRRLAKALRDRGVPALVVGVVELHPKRRTTFARDLPHLHVLFRGRTHRWQPWALSPRELDLIVFWALWDACCWDPHPEMRCSVEPVKKSVRRYLSKYLSKSPPFGGHQAVDNSPVQLIPRQWWFESREIVELRRTLTKEIPAEFLAFLIDRRHANREGQLYHAWQANTGEGGAPIVWQVGFRSPWALFLCWEAYEVAVGYWPVHPIPT
jgi:hypothetical protein